MKKNFIAKLLVLGLVLTMLPVAAFAESKPYAPGPEGTAENKVYWTQAGNPYGIQGDTRVDLFFNKNNNTYYFNSDDTKFTITLPSNDTKTPETPADTTVPPVTVTIDAITDDMVEATETATIVTVKVTAKNGVASAALSEAAQESLIAKLQEGKALTLKADVEGDATKVAYTLSGSLLATVAEKTGADMSLDLTVATVTIPSAALAKLGDYENVAVVADKTEGAYVVAIMADGKAINEKVEGLVVKF